MTLETRLSINIIRENRVIKREIIISKHNQEIIRFDAETKRQLLKAGVSRNMAIGD